MLGAPDWALEDEIVTMRPHPAAIMSGTANCTQVKVPVRFTADPFPLLGGDVEHRVEGFDSCTGDKDCDRPELVPHGGEDALHCAALSDIHLERRRSQTPLREIRGCLTKAVAIEIE
jgi:hypothetical protein